MKDGKRWLALGLASMLLPAPMAVMAQGAPFQVDDPETYVIRVEPRAWFVNDSSLDGTFPFDVIGSPAVAGLDASFDDETRLNPFIELQLGGRHKLRGAFLELGQVATLAGDAFDISVNGVPIDQALVPLSEAVGSVDLTIYELGYQYDLFEGDWGFIGALIDVAVVDYDLTATASYDSTGDGAVDQQSTKSADGTIAIPQVGVAFRVYPSRRVALRAEAKGLTIGPRGTFIQGFGGFELQLSQQLGIGGGYQFLRLDIDVSDVDLTYQDHGPYAGTVIRF
ncbi:MAG: hypothetical protein ACE5E4_08150 [Candidatus Binatia bacterium]